MEALSQRLVADRSCGDVRSYQRGAPHPPSSPGLQPGSPTEPCECPLSDEDAAFLLLLGWNKTLKN